ncbi:peptidyl-prolyl cis-trans isomerase [Thermaurantiacus sp.]
MLGWLRKAVTSWIGLAILGLALVAMVVTLFYGQAPGPASSSGGRVVATVGAASVTEPELVRAINIALDRQREETPQMTMPEFVRLGGADLVLEQLILARALEQFGATAKVPVGKRLIDGEIASLPPAQVGGKFDENAFRRLLAQRQLSEADLRRDIASEISRRMVLFPAAIGLRTPDSLAEPFASVLLEERSGRIAAVPVDLMPVPPLPDEKVLKAFWQDNRASWTVPERRSFRYAMVDLVSLVQSAQPTEAEIEAYWKANPEEFGGVALRNLSQVVLPDEAAAKAFVARVRGGEDFAAVASAAGFAPADTAIGQVSEASFAVQTDKAIAAAAFRAPQGGVTDPLKGAFGWHVVKVESIVPARPVPLAEARAGIASKLAATKAERALAERVSAIEDRLEAGEPMAEVARAFSMPIESAGPMTADGQTLDAQNQLVPGGHPLLAKAFAADPEDGPVVVEATKDQYAILEVAEVIPATLIPFERIRDRVAAAWQVNARIEAARKVADEMAAASKGEDLAALARARNLPLPQALTVQRLQLSQMAQAGQQIPPPVLLLLNVPVGEARVASAPGARAWYVVRTEAARPGDVTKAPQLVSGVRDSMSRDAGNEMAETFARAIQRAVGVVRQPAAIAAVKARLSGAAEPGTGEK